MNNKTKPFMVNLKYISNQLLLYRNIKISLFILYSIIGIVVYLKWNLIAESWLTKAKRITAIEDEFTSYVAMIYFVFISIYAFILLLAPLTIFDKRHAKGERVSIVWPEFNRLNILKSSKDIILFLSFPVLAIFGIALWLIFSITFEAIAYFMSGIGIMLLIIAFFYLVFQAIRKLFR